jgi:hypothetical protein
MGPWDNSGVTILFFLFSCFLTFFLSVCVCVLHSIGVGWWWCVICLFQTLCVRAHDDVCVCIYIYICGQQKAQASFEAQRQNDTVSSSEAEEMAVQKRRAEGTPCTRDHFLQWKHAFETAAEQQRMAVDSRKDKDCSAAVAKSGAGGLGAMTGYEYFSGQAGNNLAALEAAAEAAEHDEMEEGEEEEMAVNEELFDDDVDLDELDFDSEEDGNEDDADEEVDI